MVLLPFFYFLIGNDFFLNVILFLCFCFYLRLLILLFCLFLLFPILKTHYAVFLFLTLSPNFEISGKDFWNNLKPFNRKNLPFWVLSLLLTYFIFFFLWKDCVFKCCFILCFFNLACDVSLFLNAVIFVGHYKPWSWQQMQIFSLIITCNP